MSASLQTERTTVRRLAKRGVYDREAIVAIIDEASAMWASSSTDDLS